MLILSHRGLWDQPDEKNTPAAFARSFEAGFGTETDVRDCLRKLVVSHDPPGADAVTVDALLGLYRDAGRDLPLALNIKADGLHRLLPAVLDAFAIGNCFVFDMSIPDALGWLATGVPTFTRHSEVEPHPAYYDRAAGVWLDAFHGDWWDADVVARHLDAGKQVCVVSPDLHGRDPRPAWDRLATPRLRGDPRLMLCTDRPRAATEAGLG